MKYKIYFVIFVYIIFLFSGCEVFTSDNQKRHLFIDNLSLEQEYNSYVDDKFYYYFDDGLYQAEKYGTIKNLIPYTENAERWCIFDKYLYFTTMTQDIYQLNLVNYDLKVLLNTKPFVSYDMESVSNLFATEKFLFLQLGTSFYLYDLSEDEMDLISDDARSIALKNEKLYFCGRDFSIHEFDPQTRENKVLLKSQYSDENGYFANLYKNFIFVGDSMYYYLRKPYGLYCFNSGKSELISDHENINEFSLCVYENELYFVEFQGIGEPEKLLKYNAENGIITQVLFLEDYNRGAKIIDGFFYYRTSDFELKKIKLSGD